MGNKLFRLLALILFPLFTATAQAADDVSSFSLNLNTVNDIQLAKSYWLGGADIGLTFEGDDDETRCRAMGYTSDSCPGNETPVKFCGSNNQYHMCGCDSSVYKYTTENCPYGSVPDADVCDGYSRGCTCGESGYVWDEESGSCIFSCTSDSDCPTGEVCDISEGQCYECLQSRDCGEGYECIDHQCEEVDLCDGVECTGGQSCNENTGECECPSGTELLDGQCQEANCLNGGKGCPDSTPVCREDGQCVQCTSTNQSACGADEKCNSDNKCEKIDRCDGVNCSGGKDCNPDNGQCECPSGTIEVDGVCETPNCSNGGDSWNVRAEPLRSTASAKLRIAPTAAIPVVAVRLTAPTTAAASNVRRTVIAIAQREKNASAMVPVRRRISAMTRQTDARPAVTAIPRPAFVPAPEN